MILIFSRKFEQSTDEVINWLHYKGADVLRINTEEDTYSFDSITSDGIYFKNKYSNELVNLLQADVCWWRRTGIGYPHFCPSSSPIQEKEGLDLSSFTQKGNRKFYDEYRRLREYIYYKVYTKCKINLGKPLFDLNRLVTLEIAKASGLDIPPFEIITNSMQLARSKQTLGNAVSKAISNGIYDESNGYRFYTYTELIDEELYQAENLHFFPSLVTQMVEKEYEIRSFYIDGKFYSMAIFSQSNEQTKIDFRKYADNRKEPYQLPAEIEEKTRTVFRALELNTGSIDYIVDKKGRHLFLEINPVGQYGMTSFPCNYNLSEIIANYLLYGTAQNSQVE